MDIIIALSGLSVTLLGALVAVVWRGATLVAQLQSAVQQMREALQQMREGLESLHEIPVLRTQIGQLQEVQRAQQSQIASLWDKVFSTRLHAVRIEAESTGRHRALSSHDIDPKSST